MFTLIWLCLCIAANPIPNIGEPSPQKLPPSTLHLSKETLEHMDRERFLRKLFPVTRMVPLELTEQSALKGVQGFIFSGSTFYVIDENLGPVYRFDRDGHFVGLLGQMGQGPGEYQKAISIDEIFDGNLAVTDWHQGRIHVYSPAGQFLFSTPKPPHGTNGLFINGPGLAWPQKETLILANFSNGTIDPNQNWHAVVKLGYAQQNRRDIIESFTPVGAFSERYERSDGAAPFHNGIGVVNDTLWIGSPYGSHIEIYDFQGRKIKSLARTCRRTVTHAQFKAAEEANDQTLMSQYTNFGCTTQWKIIRVGPLVMVNQAHGGIFFYDETGEPIGRPGGYLSAIGLLHTSYEDGLASAINPETLTKPAYEAERKALEARGFDLEELGHANPIVRVGAFLHE